MDPRVAKGVVSDIASDKKIYSGYYGFCSIATTEEG